MLGPQKIPLSLPVGEMPKPMGTGVPDDLIGPCVQDQWDSLAQRSHALLCMHVKANKSKSTGSKWGDQHQPLIMGSQTARTSSSFMESVFL